VQAVVKRVKRYAVAMVVLAAVAVVAAGCGAKKEASPPPAPPRSALAERLAHLCNQARAETEALGLPGDVGFKVMKPTAQIGLRFAAKVKKLKGTTPQERRQIARVAEGFRFYYNELRAAVELYAVGHSEVYEITLSRAKPSLESAEKLATRMGAPECAVRPFPDR
jgi:hypothetical protein